jgi:hypothetical protein
MRGARKPLAASAVSNWAVYDGLCTADYTFLSLPGACRIDMLTKGFDWTNFRIQAECVVQRILGSPGSATYPAMCPLPLTHVEYMVPKSIQPMCGWRVLASALEHGAASATSAIIITRQDHGPGSAALRTRKGKLAFQLTSVNMELDMSAGRGDRTDITGGQ